jgi:hypothetical protein
LIPHDGPARWRSSCAGGGSTSPSARSTRWLRKEARLWVRRLHDKLGIATILVTHDQVEAMEFADRVAVIERGKVVQFDPPAALIETPATPFVAGFLGQAVRVACTVRYGVAYFDRLPPLRVGLPDGAATAFLRQHQVMAGPGEGAVLSLLRAEHSRAVVEAGGASLDAILHRPPRAVRSAAGGAGHQASAFPPRLDQVAAAHAVRSLIRGIEWIGDRPRFDATCPAWRTGGGWRRRFRLLRLCGGGRGLPGRHHVDRRLRRGRDGPLLRCRRLGGLAGGEALIPARGVLVGPGLASRLGAGRRAGAEVDNLHDAAAAGAPSWDGADFAPIGRGGSAILEAGEDAIYFGHQSS